MASTKACTGCGDVLPVTAFAWKDRARGRRYPRCPDCQRAFRRARYAARPDAQRASVERTRAVRSARNRELLDALKSGPCADCGRRFPSEAMDFDHVRGTKVANLGDVVRDWSVHRLLVEAAKCDLVCANCHRNRTASRARGE